MTILCHFQHLFILVLTLPDIKIKIPVFFLFAIVKNSELFCFGSLVYSIELDFALWVK